MNQCIRDQRGIISLLEIGLIVVVLAVVGLAGYSYLKAGHKTATQSQSAATSANPHPSANNSHPSASPVEPYAGWATFTGTCSGYSFKYPQDWNVSMADSFVSGQCQITTVESPSGNKLMWIPSNYGDGPGCDWSNVYAGGKNECPTIITLKSEDVQLPGGVSGGYLVEQVVCNASSKCEGRVALALGTSANPRFQVGTSQRYPVLVFGPHAMYMTQGKQAGIGNPPQPIFNFDAASARAWLSSDDVQKAELAMKSLAAKAD